MRQFCRHVARQTYQASLMTTFWIGTPAIAGVAAPLLLVRLSQGRPAAVLPLCRVLSGAMTRIRVVLAEDHVLLREGISRLVAADEDLELVGTAGDLPQLLALVERELPDVVVTDIRMPPTGTNEGIQAAAWARQHQPAIG